jgi:membrane protein YqaA with SNARE-associated domain
MGWKESIIDWFDIFGPAALAMLSFTEAIIQPVPPDLLYLPMLLDAGGDAPLVFWLWLVVTFTSVCGALVGYVIGQRFGVQLIEFFGYERHLISLQRLTEKYGGIGIFIAACSPLPYKVFGWIAGMASMDKRNFFLAGMLGRGLRFGAEAILIWFYGDALLNGIMWFLDHELLLGIVLVASIALVWYILFKSKSKPSPQSLDV